MRVGRVVRSDDSAMNGFIVVEVSVVMPGDINYYGDEPLSKLSIVRGDYYKEFIKLYSRKMDWFDNEVKTVGEAKLIYG